jgi:hypothetical protein
MPRARSMDGRNAQSGRTFRTNVREVGGRAAEGMDRESVRNAKGRPNANKAISDRVRGNAAQRRS